ncbi:MAG: hypothetical protein SV375_05825 [Thermodesulfobacteriota bacterium]|nr:hypothetical protein [Thermodesulfobacteriota bacterium]
MNQDDKNKVVEIIGGENFQWLSKEFNRDTRLKDVPTVILNRISSVDITLRDFSGDKNSITSIALLTFAYKMDDKIQDPRYGSNDMMLLKVLAKDELRRREGKRLPENRLWDAPLYELITGEVGERIRMKKFMTNPM